MTRQVCGTPSPNSRAGVHTPAGHSHTVLCEENHRGFLIINTQLTHNSQAFLPPASLAYTAHKFFSQRPQVQRWQPPSLSKHKAPPGERQSHSSKVLYKKNKYTWKCDNTEPSCEASQDAVKCTTEKTNKGSGWQQGHQSFPLHSAQAPTEASPYSCLLGTKATAEHGMLCNVLREAPIACTARSSCAPPRLDSHLLPQLKCCSPQAYISKRVIFR